MPGISKGLGKWWLWGLANDCENVTGSWVTEGQRNTESGSGGKQGHNQKRSFWFQTRHSDRDDKRCSKILVKKIWH